MPRHLAAVLTAAALTWCAVIIAAPVAVTRGGGQLAAPLTVLYRAAGRLCHQRPERSFHVAGIQQPVCARCFGLYLSGALGAVLGWTAFRPRRRPADRPLLIVAALPTALTFGLEVAGLAQPSSAVRAMAALPLGLTAGWIFVRTLRNEAGLVPPARPLQR